jgi:squalene-hopene/tetraprenyl-beta-curcumene cyclase
VPNVSATAFALDGLRTAGVRASAEAVQKARVFLERCQNFSIAKAKPGSGESEQGANTGSPRASLLPADEPESNRPFDDGGFFFLLEDCVRNKAGEAGTDAARRVRYRSYGSATADGLRALLACGLSAEHPRVVAARRWLLKNFSATEHPGEYAADRGHQRPALFYYYAASVAAALGRGEPAPDRAATSPAWATGLAVSLLSRQDADGGWRNSNVEIREDDPLVATPLAMRAFHSCRRALANQ